jgi:heat shock protein HtpX
MRRPELFPTDKGLLARMLVAAVLTPLIVLAALAVVVLAAPTKLAIGVGIAAIAGVAMAVRERGEAAHGREVGAGEAPELHAIVERLCVVADMPKPAIVIEDEAMPNSWIVSLGREHARLHVTRGLLERLEPAELEAVVAHELSHVAHRDATVMTVVGGPGAVLLSGGARTSRGWWPMMVGGLMAIAIGWVASIGTRMLSRYREFAADAGAASLTGNPAALASALIKVSDGVAALPPTDLRAVAARDPFHLLPVARDEGDRLMRALPSSHPSLQARIARLERLEAGLQHPRRG